jgi:anaerobic selenocysteine-containing dehydrogenase
MRKGRIKMVSRRDFLKISLAAGAGLFLPVKFLNAQAI